MSNFLFILISLELLKFFTTARVFKDKINILKASLTLKQLENNQIIKNDNKGN